MLPTLNTHEKMRTTQQTKDWFDQVGFLLSLSISQIIRDRRPNTHDFNDFILQKDNIGFCSYSHKEGTIARAI